MLGLLVVTHGEVAKQLVASVRKIVGNITNLEAVSIDWNDVVNEATRRIEEARKRVDGGQGVLLLTDMFGGTPTNLALSMLQPGKLEIVTGVNLPMLIKFANLDEGLSLPDAAMQLADEARASIHVASRLLQGTSQEPQGDER
jgi:PTS system mannose-specific IIA component